MGYSMYPPASINARYAFIGLLGHLSEKVREEEWEMEAHSSVKNGENIENPIVGCVIDVAEEENEESIKKRISSHPLFGLLIETHLNCLKVGLGELGEVGTTNAANHANFNPKATVPSSSELDRFMEAYCSALENLKEAMEEPQQEMASFIDAMYFQLGELCESDTNDTNPKTSF